MFFKTIKDLAGILDMSKAAVRVRIVALALREATIPLQQSFSPEELMMAKVRHSWTQTVQNTEKEKSAKMYLPVTRAM